MSWLINGKDLFRGHARNGFVGILLLFTEGLKSCLCLPCGISLPMNQVLCFCVCYLLVVTVNHKKLTRDSQLGSAFRFSTCGCVVTTPCLLISFSHPPLQVSRACVRPPSLCLCAPAWTAGPAAPSERHRAQRPCRTRRCPWLPALSRRAAGSACWSSPSCLCCYCWRPGRNRRSDRRSIPTRGRSTSPEDRR